MNDVVAAPTMRKYELFLCLDPNMTEKETKNEMKKIKDLIAAAGEIFHEQVWGKRDLYYKIQKQEKGIYTLLYFTFSPEKIVELKRDLGLTKSVFRYNLQNLPENYTVPVREEKPAESEEAEVEKPVKKVTKTTPLPVEPVAKVKVEKTEEASAEEDAEKPSVSARGKMTNFDEGLDKIISDLS